MAGVFWGVARSGSGVRSILVVVVWPESLLAGLVFDAGFVGKCALRSDLGLFVGVSVAVVCFGGYIAMVHPFLVAVRPLSASLARFIAAARRLKSAATLVRPRTRA